MNEQELQQLVASVTPERVRDLVLQFEPKQPAPNRGTVPVYLLLDEFGRGLPLDEFGRGLPLADAAEGVEVDMRLRPAIMAAVSQIPGMTFMEGDG